MAAVAVALVAFVLVAVLIYLNDRARRRLEGLGGDKGDPTRRRSWMRFGA